MRQDRWTRQSAKSKRNPAAWIKLTGPSGSSTSGTGVLTTDTELPVVSETPVGPDLLQLLNVVPQLLVDNVGDDVKVLSVGDILPPVQEPGGDLELGGVLHDGDDSLELIRVELSGTDNLRRLSSALATIVAES